MKLFCKIDSPFKKFLVLMIIIGLILISVLLIRTNKPIKNQLLVNFICNKPIQYLEYLASNERYQELVENQLAHKCYAPHPDIVEIFAQEGFDYLNLDKKFTADSLRKLTDLTLEEANEPKIPPITHKVYFTAKNNSKKLYDFYIEELKTNYTRLNSLNTLWKHLIWTNQPDLFPKEITDIKGVEIRSIAEFKNHQSYKDLLIILNKGDDFKPHLAEASDITRLLALQKFGGIYSDMDYEIYNPEKLFKLMKKFDFIGTRETINIHSLYPNGFIAAKPNHPILNESLKRILRNHNITQNNKKLPEYLKYPCNRYDQIFFNGTILTTLAYFSKNNTEGNMDIILPSWMAINIEFAKYKNQTCNLAEINKENFKQRNDNLNVLIAEFNANPVAPNFMQHCSICNEYNPLTQNIYYNLKDHTKFDIIGADMSCGTWITDRHDHFYYWKFPLELLLNKKRN